MPGTTPSLGALVIVWRSLGILWLRATAILFGLAWYLDWFPPESARRELLGNWLAVAGVGASCWALLPALLRIARAMAGGW